MSLLSRWPLWWSCLEVLLSTGRGLSITVPQQVYENWLISVLPSLLFLPFWGWSHPSFPQPSPPLLSYRQFVVEGRNLCSLPCWKYWQYVSCMINIVITTNNMSYFNGFRHTGNVELCALVSAVPNEYPLHELPLRRLTIALASILPNLFGHFGSLFNSQDFWQHSNMNRWTWHRQT